MKVTEPTHYVLPVIERIQAARVFSLTRDDIRSNAKSMEGMHTYYMHSAGFVQEGLPCSACSGTLKGVVERARRSVVPAYLMASDLA